MPHVMRRRGLLEGTALAGFLALVHTVNDAITAILGALLPTIQQRFDASPAVLATIVATYWIASSVTQPLFGSLAEDVGMRLVGSTGVLFAALCLSLVGVAPTLYLVFVLLVIGGMGSAALHPVGTTVARGTTVNNAALGVGFFTAGGMLGFGFGPVLVLYLIERYGTESTPWLMVPGLLLALLFFFVLPDWQPHGWHRLLDVFELRLLRGPIGWLALAASFTSVSFVTFTSSIPVWLVNEEGFAPDDPVIGWTLCAFSVSAGLGSLMGGTLAPRIGRRTTVVASLLAAVIPLLLLLRLEPATPAFFTAAALAGLLIYTSSPVKIVAAQDLAPRSRAAASGIVLGLSAGVAGVFYIGLGMLQEVIGLEPAIVVGFVMVIPAAIVAGRVLSPARGGRSASAA